jgi:hypothetical protein
LKQDADAALLEFQHELKSSLVTCSVDAPDGLRILQAQRIRDCLAPGREIGSARTQMYAGRNVLGRVLLELGQTDRAITELEAAFAWRQRVRRCITRWRVPSHALDVRRMQLANARPSSSSRRHLMQAPGRTEAAEDSLGNLPSGPSGLPDRRGPGSESRDDEVRRPQKNCRLSVAGLFLLLISVA